MKTDFDDWQDFNDATLDFLKNRKLAGKTIIKYLMRPSFEDFVQISLIQKEDNETILDVGRWHQVKDMLKMLNPLEKVKLFGNYKPTIEYQIIAIKEEEKEYSTRRFL